LTARVEATENQTAKIEKIRNSPEQTQANKEAAEAATRGSWTWKRILMGLGGLAGALLTGSAISIALLNIRALGSTCSIMGPATGGTLQVFTCDDIQSFKDMPKVDALNKACACDVQSTGCEADPPGSPLGCTQGTDCSSGPCSCGKLTIDKSKNIATEVQGCAGPGPFATCVLPGNKAFQSTWLCPQHDPASSTAEKTNTYYYEFHYLGPGEIVGKWLTGLGTTINQDVGGLGSILAWLIKNAKWIIVAIIAIWGLGALARIMGH
jgi:hypothetical protein